MPNRPATPSNRRPRPAAVLLAMSTLMVLVAGCAVATSPGPAGSTAPAPSATPAGTAPATGTATAGATDGPGPSVPGQTDTAWGRIWDSLPSGFPRYPGASPASIGRGPVSAEFTVSADPTTVLSALRSALEAAGYSTVNQSGPLEDGSRTLESGSATAGCRVQTTVGPLGGLTYIAVLFGAACPFR